MSFTTRFIKIALLASMALFFTLAGFSNWIDFGTNLEGVKHVLSMDTTMHTKLMSRAVTNSNIQRYAYILLFSWEIITGILCWIGSVILLLKLKQEPERFNQAKTLGLIGLLFGLLIYLVGFMDIGGEWFAMWQSTSWNVQANAGMFSILLLLILILLNLADK